MVIDYSQSFHADLWRRRRRNTLNWRAFKRICHIHTDAQIRQSKVGRKLILLALLFSFSRSQSRHHHSSFKLAALGIGPNDDFDSHERFFALAYHLGAHRRRRRRRR